MIELLLNARTALKPIAIVLVTSVLLAGCAGGLPGIATDAELQQVPIDQQVALAMLNNYRARYAAAPLRTSPDLRLVAQDMADHIAGRDRLKSPQHSPRGLYSRLLARGVKHDAAGENLGYGYADLNAAFAGWRGSLEHNRNLLNPNVTHMGLARTNRADGTYRNFWALIMARPEN